jgi:hypothetical protein
MEQRVLPQFDTDDMLDAGPRFAEWVETLTRLFNVKQVRDDALKRDYLLLYGGLGLSRIYRPLRAANDDFDDVVEKLTAHFNPRTNVNLNVFQFRSIAQREAESFDDFVSRLREKASTCEFGQGLDQQLSFQIMHGCRDDSSRRKPSPDPTSH